MSAAIERLKAALSSTWNSFWPWDSDKLKVSRSDLNAALATIAMFEGEEKRREQERQRLAERRLREESRPTRPMTGGIPLYSHEWELIGVMPQRDFKMDSTRLRMALLPQVLPPIQTEPGGERVDTMMVRDVVAEVLPQTIDQGGVIWRGYILRMMQPLKPEEITQLPCVLLAGQHQPVLLESALDRIYGIACGR